MNSCFCISLDENEFKVLSCRFIQMRETRKVQLWGQINHFGALYRVIPRGELDATRLIACGLLLFAIDELPLVLR